METIPKTRGDLEAKRIIEATAEHQVKHNHLLIIADREICKISKSNRLVN